MYRGWLEEAKDPKDIAIVVDFLSPKGYLMNFIIAYENSDFYLAILSFSIQL